MKIAEKSQTNIKMSNQLKFRKGHWQLASMTLPAVILLFIFAYIPMFGIVVAFKNFKFSQGIWGSQWNGIDNFKFLFRSNTLNILLRNTLGYNIVGIILGRVIPVCVALVLEKVINKNSIKVYQSGMFLPYFLSWVVVSYFSFAMFEYDSGLINNIISFLGGTKISFYSEPKYWPWILIFFAQWKGLGYSVLIYYGTLLGIDTSLYEAATIDGCGYWGKVWNISLPYLIQPIVILFLLGLGGIFRSDYGLYYFIPKDTGALYNVTDVLDTYILRTLRSATNLGLSSAMTFLQSAVGFIFVIVGNTIARRIDEDCALF